MASASTFGSSWHGATSDGRTLAAWPPRVSADDEAPASSSSPPSSPPASDPLDGLDLAPGDHIAVHYLLIERMADGGMGTLWTAIDERDGREVVVKMLCRELLDNDEAQRRFEQEVDLIASLESPHIVSLFDSGVHEGAPFMVLERLHGEDLEVRLRRGPLSLDESATILEQVASALLVAHMRGVIHRDVKPANIFLARIDGREVVKLLDFGVAKLRDRQRIRTGAGITVGSPEFMSPEQIQGLQNLDGRSDLFGLGGVAYCCLTGRLPFAGRTIADTFQRILRGAFDPPSRVDPGLPRALDGFFARAFAIDPARRFPNAAALAAELRDIVDLERFAGRRPPPADLPRWLGSTAIAPPPPPVRRVEKRRLAVAAAMLASMVGLWTAVWVLSDDDRTPTQQEPPAVEQPLPAPSAPPPPREQLSVGRVGRR